MKNPNQPAYPVKEIRTDTGLKVKEGFDGLTKREYFAGLAMQGLLATNATYGGKTDAREKLAFDAIAHADELLKQLEK